MNVLKKKQEAIERISTHGPTSLQDESENDEEIV